MLVFVDADVVVHADALDRIRARLRDPALDAVFGSYDDAPEAPGRSRAFATCSTTTSTTRAPGRRRASGPGWAPCAARRSTRPAGSIPSAAGSRTSSSGRGWSQAGARIELDPAIQGTHLKRYTLALDAARRHCRARDPVGRPDARRPRAAQLAERRRQAPGRGVCWRSARPSARAALPAGRGRRSLGAFAALNADLYATIARRRGRAEAAAAVPLHVLHHVSATAAIPAGVALHLRRRYSAAT